MAEQKLVSASTVRRHCTAEDCWIVVDGKVWDISAFLPEHPGGVEGTFFDCSFFFPMFSGCMDF